MDQRRDQRSLGLIETWGLTAAIEAADAGAKAANVDCQGYELGRGGLVTVKFLGDVAAVRAAVSAASVAAARIGKVVSTHVIARPNEQLRRLGLDGPPGGGARPGTKEPAAPVTPESVSSPAPDALAEPSSTPVSQTLPEPRPDPKAPAVVPEASPAARPASPPAEAPREKPAVKPGSTAAASGSQPASAPSSAPVPAAPKGGRAVPRKGGAKAATKKRP